MGSLGGCRLGRCRGGCGGIDRREGRGMRWLWGKGGSGVGGGGFWRRVRLDGWSGCWVGGVVGVDGRRGMGVNVDRWLEGEDGGGCDGGWNSGRVLFIAEKKLLMASPDQQWYMDIGATSHLSSHTGNLQTSSLNRNFHSVIVGNESFIPVTHSGHLQIPNPYRPLHLKNVLVIPNIIKNLVSVRKFTTDNKCSIDFDPYGFTVRDYHTRQTLLRCDSTGDLYPLHVAASAFAPLTNNHSLWHQRLGHPDDNARLSPEYWVEALLTAAYLLNILPSTSINNDIPYTKLFNKPTSYTYLRTFGCLCYPYTFPPHKLAPLSRQWPIHQLDVKNAFLHGHLTKTVYMHQPPGFTDSAHSDYVCLLQKSLYGLKQAPRACFFYFTPATYHLFTTCGICYDRPWPTQLFSRTPIDTEKKLGPEGSPVTDPTLNHSLAGSLQYLTFTRPDLSYAVQQLCLYMHDHREPHLNAMKRVLCYLQGTTDLGLQLFRSITSQLIAYSDANWAGCPATRRSTSGYCVFLGYNLLTWSSKRQDMLSRSSVEAEYREVANVVAETSWIHNLLCELHTPLFTTTLVYCDNVSDVYMSANPVQHQRTKHIKIDIHFVRDRVAAGHVRVLHVPSRFQYADIFTKGLPYPLFTDFRSSLSM
ncbi:ribonuclease H-like domain-containing protein [Tanacetum coccineum]